MTGPVNWRQKQFDKMREDTSSKRGEKSCRGMMKIRRKRQESDSGHFVKSLNETAMIQTSREELKLS